MNEAGRPQKAPTPATVNLCFAILAGVAFEMMTGAWANPELLRVYGANLPIETLRVSGEYWRFLTSMFLPGGGTIGGTLLHAAVNLVTLFQVGALFEMMFGTRRFIVIYFAAGIAASLTSSLNLAYFSMSVGASGAIAGIIGAFISSVFRSARFRHDRTARSIVGQLLFWIVLNIALAQSMEGIDHFAHAGGFAAGLLLGALLPHRPPPPPTPRGAVIDVRPHDD